MVHAGISLSNNEVTFDSQAFKSLHISIRVAKIISLTGKPCQLFTGTDDVGFSAFETRLGTVGMAVK